MGPEAPAEELLFGLIPAVCQAAAQHGRLVPCVGAWPSAGEHRVENP